jgi:uncharacterized protein (TIGR02001 family)
MIRKEVFAGVLTLLLAAMMCIPASLNAQDDESSSPFSVGADLVSSYVWRGTQYGNSPAVQPYVEFAAGGFSIGGWGSYDLNGFAEADLYLSYGFDFGLSIGLTDYYYPGSPYFEYGSPDGSHGFEINLGYEIGGLALSANYMLNEASGAGTAGDDLYFEVGYSFSYFGIHVGAGNGWHTMEADADEEDFNVCNIGITASKEVSITEKFSLPMSGALILNPDTEQFHVVIGVSF